MQNSKIFPGTIPRTPVFECEKFVVVLRKSKLSYCEINAEFKILAGNQATDLRFMEEESLFSFFKNVLKLPYRNAEFKTFPGDITPDPRFREKESLFCYPKMYQNSPTAMQNSKFLPAKIP